MIEFLQNDKEVVDRGIARLRTAQEKLNKADHLDRLEWEHLAGQILELEGRLKMIDAAMKQARREDSDHDHVIRDLRGQLHTASVNYHNLYYSHAADIVRKLKLEIDQQMEPCVLAIQSREPLTVTPPAAIDKAAESYLLAIIEFWLEHGDEGEDPMMSVIALGVRDKLDTPENRGALIDLDTAKEDQS